MFTYVAKLSVKNHAPYEKKKRTAHTHSLVRIYAVNTGHIFYFTLKKSEPRMLQHGFAGVRNNPRMRSSRFIFDFHMTKQSIETKCKAFSGIGSLLPNSLRGWLGEAKVSPGRQAETGLHLGLLSLQQVRVEGLCFISSVSSL